MNAKDHIGVWPAELNFKVSACPLGHQRSLMHFEHRGPLRIQKALYPEGETTCHVIVIHPPGGIAGGDQLTLRAGVAHKSSALVTTPGATKWYGSTGILATQSIELEVDGDLEWLPQETIIFNRAKAHSSLKITLGDNARMMGWDCLIFGRTQSSEVFAEGDFSQVITFYLDGVLVWEERLRIHGNDPLFRSKIGLCGQATCSVFWAVLPKSDSWSSSDLEEIRAKCPQIAWSRLESRLLVGRQTGIALTVRERQLDAWKSLRARVVKKNPESPRIWAT